jgi:hypothetical protein
VATEYVIWNVSNIKIKYHKRFLHFKSKNAVRDPALLWPGGIVYYTIDTGFSKSFTMYIAKKYIIRCLFISAFNFNSIIYFHFYSCWGTCHACRRFRPVRSQLMHPIHRQEQRERLRNRSENWWRVKFVSPSFAMPNYIGLVGVV